MAKSTHQPFEDWLFTEEPLAPEQFQALREHLRDCEDCRRLEASWNGVRRTLRAAPEAAPAPGFTARWQERLAVQRLQRQRRQAWVVLILTVGVVIELLFALSAPMLELMRSPGNLLVAWVYLISNLASITETAQEAIRAIWQAGPVLLSLGATILLGAVSFWSVLWAVIYQQLSTRRIRL